jgi:hypothetical protein
LLLTLLLLLLLSSSSSSWRKKWYNSNIRTLSSLSYICLHICSSFVITIQTQYSTNPPRLSISCSFLLVAADICPTPVDVFFHCGKVKMLLRIIWNVVFVLLGKTQDTRLPKPDFTAHWVKTHTTVTNGKLWSVVRGFRNTMQHYCL